VPTAVCGAIAYQVSAMGQDADRLLEETRESAIASRLVVRIDTLKSLVEPEGDEPLHPRVRRIAIDHVAAAEELLEQLHEGPEEEDPSREEHQSAEADLMTAVEIGLDRTSAWLGGSHELSYSDVERQLEQARRNAVILSEE